MKLIKDANTVHIHITTNPRMQQEHLVHSNRNMDSSKRYDAFDHRNRFICSVCLNSKTNNITETCKGKSKSCPICQNHRSNCKQQNKSVTDKSNDTKHDSNKDIQKKILADIELNSKTIQTSQTDIKDGLTLLNEVLNVFKAKRKEVISDAEKSVKDVAVSAKTDNLPKLVVSKTFNVSIEDKEHVNKLNKNKFVVLHSSQPEVKIKSKFLIDLTKEKSSSIPQMKLEELKNSLKERTKSKDVIDEVNRMFATVCRNNVSEHDNNRPVIRNGPRLLPVVLANPTSKLTSNEFENVNKTTCICCKKFQCISSSGDASTRKFVECHKHKTNRNLRHDNSHVCCYYENHCCINENAPDSPSTAISGNYQRNEVYRRNLEENILERGDNCPCNHNCF